MTACFADTAYYLALISEHDSAHRAAEEFTNSYTGRIVTTSAVITKLGNHLSSPTDRPAFIWLVKLVQDDPDVRLIHVDRSLFRNGIALFEQRMDQRWSLTDCISFLVMDAQKLKDALTTDHHFEQAGFRALFKEAKP